MRPCRRYVRTLCLATHLEFPFPMAGIPEPDIETLVGARTGGEGTAHEMYQRR